MQGAWVINICALLSHALVFHWSWLEVTLWQSVLALGQVGGKERRYMGWDLVRRTVYEAQWLLDWNDWVFWSRLLCSTCICYIRILRLQGTLFKWVFPPDCCVTRAKQNYGENLSFSFLYYFFFLLIIIWCFSAKVTDKHQQNKTKQKIYIIRLEMP